MVYCKENMNELFEVLNEKLKEDEVCTFISFLNRDSLFTIHFSAVTINEGYSITFILAGMVVFTMYFTELTEYTITKFF